MGTQRAERTASGRPQARHKFTYCHGEARRRAEGRKIHRNRESLSAAPPRQRHLHREKPCPSGSGSRTQGPSFHSQAQPAAPPPHLPGPPSHLLPPQRRGPAAPAPGRPIRRSLPPAAAAPSPAAPRPGSGPEQHLTEGALSRTGSSPSAPEGAKAVPPAVHHPPSRAPTARWDCGPGDTWPLHPPST